MTAINSSFDVLSVSASWITLTERPKRPFFYKKSEVYRNIRWGDNFNMAEHAFAVAPHGGPIAIYKKPTASVGADAADKSNDKSESFESQEVHIFTSSGRLLSVIEWKGKGTNGRIHEIAWTPDFHVILLTRGGYLTVYDIHGAMLYMEEASRQVALGKEEFIVKSKFSGNAAALFTSDGRLLVCEDLSLLTSVSTVDDKEKANRKRQQQRSRDSGSFEHTNNTDDPDGSPDTAFKQWNISEPKFTVTTMELLPREAVLARDEVDSAEVFLCGCEGEIDDSTDYMIVIVNATKSYKVNMEYGEIRCIQISPLTSQGYYIATYCMGIPESNVPPGVKVFSYDFKNCLFEMNRAQQRNTVQQNQEEVYPEQIGFCGPDCIMVLYGPNALQEDISMLLIGNAFGDAKSFVYDGTILFSQENDCARIITNKTHEILERVHQSAVDVFRVGSLKGCALLYDAYNDYVKAKPSAIKTIREIKNKSKDAIAKKKHPLVKAIDNCLEAATREFREEVQLQLLKAAAFGKIFTHDLDEEMDKDAVVKRIQDIRILNEVRKRKYGIPLTIEQYRLLGPESLIAILVEMHYHKLAYKICTYLKKTVAQGHILLHWASTKVTRIGSNQQTVAEEEGEEEEGGHEDFEVSEALRQSSEFAALKDPEDRTYRIIDNVFDTYGNKSQISLADVALTAYKKDRKKLAKNLLEKDKKPQDQIPLYLSMHETHSAIKCAISSNNSDLMYMVILYLFQVLSNDANYMFELVSDEPEVERLFISYCKSHDMNRLKEFYVWKGQHRNAGMAHVADSYKLFKPDTLPKHIQALKVAMDSFEKAGSMASVDYALAEHQARVLGIQPRLEKYIDEKGRKCKLVGKTLHDTIYQCIVNGLVDKAELLRQKFDVSDKRFWTITVKAMANMKMWDSLYEFAMSTPQPQATGVFAFFRGSSDKPHSPIGFAPFVEACLNSDEPKQKKETEALKYIPHVEDPSLRVEYYINLLKFKEAIETAAALNDVDLLNYIKSKTKNSKTKETIENLVAGIKG